MSLLFQIPKDISVGVLSQWCEVGDLGRLDTAGCSVKGRSILLQIFCSPGFDLRGNVTLRWMQFCADKGMTMKSIVLCHSDFKANRHKNIVIDRLNAQKVAELQILQEDDSYEHSNETVNFCYQLANKCCALEKLVLDAAFEKRKHVDMFVTSLSITILHNLKEFSSMQSIFGVKCYKYLVKHCKLLESVTVNYVDRDTSELDIQSLLINNCMSLNKIYLNFREESNLTDKTVQCVIDHCPRIEQLTLGYDYHGKVSLSLINQMITKCTALTNFRVGGMTSRVTRVHLDNTTNIVMLNPQITNEHELSEFFTLLKHNKVIMVVTIPLLSATTLNTIALHNSTSLEEITISECPLITTADVITLINAIPTQTKVSVALCPLVDKQVVEKYLGNRMK